MNINKRISMTSHPVEDRVIVMGLQITRECPGQAIQLETELYLWAFE
jgi:hypothetical protein